jgi:alpha/beta superfamily hydrolase
MAVVYLGDGDHNKLDDEALAPFVCEQGLNLFCFDYHSTGNSLGKWVTVGWREKHDLSAVISHLKSQEFVQKITLWGSYLGGACILQFLQAFGDDPAIASIIIDSSFANFSTVQMHAVQSLPIPDMMK